MVMVMAYSFIYNPATNKQSHERHACEGKSGVLYTPSLWARVMLSLSTKSHVTYFPLLTSPHTQQSVVYTRWLPPATGYSGHEETVWTGIVGGDNARSGQRSAKAGSHVRIYLPAVHPHTHQVACLKSWILSCYPLRHSDLLFSCPHFIVLATLCAVSCCHIHVHIDLFHVSVLITECLSVRLMIAD